ncbi:MAG TPA: class I tRNA ligase family protein, partial [Candidatus Hydrogenedentes bacterium]|nr:class I tRNA ligase family protein [Candidatus Hydrogenedentota bacterium]
YVGEDGSLGARIVQGTGETGILRELHKTIRAVTQDIEGLSFNTAIARMMEFVNSALKAETLDQSSAERFALVLAPFAPHIAEELWARLGHTGSLAYEPWPDYDESLLVENTMEIPVQVLGKLRGKIEVPTDSTRESVLEAAKADPKIASCLQGKTIIKEIYVPGKMVNLVVK